MMRDERVSNLRVERNWERLVRLLFLTILAAACLAFAFSMILDRHRSRLERVPLIRSRKRWFGYGDILLMAPETRGPKKDKKPFSWKSYLRSVGIQLGTNSPFTHVAMVVMDPKGDPWVWEIASDGVRFTPLQEFFERKVEIGCKVGWRRLVSPKTNKRDTSKLLWEFASANSEIPYSSHFLAVWIERHSVVLGSTTRPPESTAPLFRGRKGPVELAAPQPNQGHFCSSLLAVALEEIGVCDWHRARLPGYWPFPKDFSGLALEAATLPSHDWDPLVLVSGIPS